MKKLILWLLLISFIINGIVFLMIISLSSYFKVNEAGGFYLTTLNLALLMIITYLLISLTLYLIFIPSFIKVQNAISENPFNDFESKSNFSTNPFNSILSAIQLNNEKSHAELEKLNTLERYRREYIGNVSHELKTPIFNIQGYVSSLLDGALEDEKVNRHFLEKAEKNVDRMTNIVMDLQTISRFEAGELELKKEVFEIHELIDDVIEIESENAAKNSVIFKLFRNKPIMVEADKFRIRQVLTNLLVNSIRYTKPGGGQTNIRINELEDFIRIEVSDNGIGIDKNHLARIFERFYRVDSSRSREKGGSGLGLAIVKHIIEAHGENIQVLSTPGVGTSFSFSLRKASV